jgi:hypothetical protein
MIPVIEKDVKIENPGTSPIIFVHKLSAAVAKFLVPGWGIKSTMA